MKPILFRIDPEIVHEFFLFTGNLMGKLPLTRTLTALLFRYQHPSLSQTLHGITFPNPIGLSEGFDKDANLLQILPAVGFGFTQIGTITDKPYRGNPKPRLFRLPKSKGVVVNFGLKNIGVDHVLPKIKAYGPLENPYSISIGKTNSQETCTDESGINDYYRCFKKVIKSGLGDFYTINISCPNTFGGEPFTTPDRLEPLLKKLMSAKPKKLFFSKCPSTYLGKNLRLCST